MAFLNYLYVNVPNEEVVREVELPTHPTETGIDLSDHVKPKAIEINLSGVIVNSWICSAAEAIEQIRQWQNTGAMIGYSGRCVAWEMQIVSFTTSHLSTIANGAEFTMTLRQARIAKNNYDNPQTPTRAETNPASANASLNTAPASNILQTGTRVVFKGGAVYVSSDAGKAAANRGRSTCKITRAAALSAEHPYHLESTDGGKVYGWVDTANIERSPSNDAKTESKAGVKQITEQSGAVYHTVKSGDTVWGLVNNNYKSLGVTCDWVIENNPDAFSVPGNPRTLQVGARLLMGTRK